MVIGAKYGKGKITRKFGTQFIACYDPDNDMFEGYFFVGTCFSDQKLEQFYSFFIPKKLKKSNITIYLINLVMLICGLSLPKYGKYNFLIQQYLQLINMHKIFYQIIIEVLSQISLLYTEK